MIAVIFEVTPREGQIDHYLALAQQLRTLVERQDGFISVERFRSVTNPDKYLSLSFWRDERAVQQWRQQIEHRAMQSKGREELFADYRLRIAGVIRDYGLQDREQAPPDSADIA